jgi:tetratricopeptide (TPR) repeat protein
MADDFMAAFDRKDYKTAARLVKARLQESPQDPLALLYGGKLQEQAGKPEAAEKLYRQVLQVTTNPKMAMQARQGLQHLEDAEKARRREQIAQATLNDDDSRTGFLVLKAIPTEMKAAAAQKFARIFQLDAYTARMLLPSRGWKLYRTGALGELSVYGQELQAAEIPVFWASLDAVRKIHVFRVAYLTTADPQPTVICQNELGQQGTLSFRWSEVACCVKGILPIFGDVVDLGPWNRLKWKEQTQDYAQVYDLHLPHRHCILRFCDSSYQFQQGMVFSQEAAEGAIAQSTGRINWNHLLQYFERQLEGVPVWTEFTAFAETAMDHLDLLDISAYVDVLRKTESHWDPAFHLYSSLVFLHSAA